MAEALNVFKTVTEQVTTTDSVIYTAPTDYTGIVLMAQVSNIGASNADVTFSHFDTSASSQTELLKNFTIPPNDAASMITGKLVLETGDSVKVQASTNGALKVTLSILESKNA